MSSADGSHIAGTAGADPRRCEVCGEPLGDSQWWVTRFPRGVHTRCRDWSKVAFPFARHVEVLEALLRRLDGDAAASARRARDTLAALAARWPEGGADAVLSATACVRRARTQLGALGVDGKALGRLA